MTDRAGPAARRALLASGLGWLFDGYETYALILVGAVAIRDLVAPDQLAQLPLYFGGLTAVTLLGWATGGLICGVLADYVGRRRMLMLSILLYAVFTGLSAAAQSYWMLVALRFLTGLGLEASSPRARPWSASCGRRPAAGARRAPSARPSGSAACWPPACGSPWADSATAPGGSCS